MPMAWEKGEKRAGVDLGLGFSGFRGQGFRGLGFRGLGFRVWGSGLRVGGCKRALACVVGGPFGTGGSFPSSGR